MQRLMALIFSLLVPHMAFAHDTWVETNTTVVRTGDAVYVDLKLGNHGNHHRDFKLSSKIDLQKVTLGIVGPSGELQDIKSELVDTGYAPKEGYWSAKVLAQQPGLHIVAHTLDTLHRTTRAIKSAKTYYLVSPSLDRISSDLEGYDRPLGHVIELVPLTNPLVPHGTGEPLRLKLLFKGQPLADATVSFIPRGEALSEGFDRRFERKTDKDGVVSFTPETANRYLAVVHHSAPEEKGTDYDATAYSATLTFLVPQIPLVSSSTP